MSSFKKVMLGILISFLTSLVLVSFTQTILAGGLLIIACVVVFIFAPQIADFMDN